MKLTVKQAKDMIDEVVLPFMYDLSAKKANDNKYIQLFTSLALHFFEIDRAKKNLLDIISFYKENGYSYDDIVLSLTKFFILVKQFSRKYKIISSVDYYKLAEVFEDTLFKKYENYGKGHTEHQDFFFMNSEFELDFEQAQQDRKISATEFLKDLELDEDDIEKLDEMKERLEMLIVRFDKEEFLEILSQLIAKLEIYFIKPELKNISKAFNELQVYLSEDMEVDEEILITIIEDIVKWIEHVFIKQDAQDINYLDEALYSNILQVEILRGGGEN